MGVFIQITVVQEMLPATSAWQIAGVCPVDIFAVEENQLVVKADQEDECTLCELCLKAAPSGAIRIHKSYSGETLVMTGNDHE